MQPAVTDRGDEADLMVSILTRPGGRVQHRLLQRYRIGLGVSPHPPRRASATWMGLDPVDGTETFQSSPAPEGECNAGINKTLGVELIVSILTRPGGRVQPEWSSA